MIPMDKERKEGFFYTASISGGKDSICMGLLLLEKGYPVDDFIFFDLGVEYPETYEAIAKFESDTGRKVARVKPPLGDFWYYSCEHEYIGKMKKAGIPMKGYGFPVFNCRWCTTKKQDAINAYNRSKGYSKKNTIQYIGIAFDEPKRIRDYPDKRYPLYEWGITEAEALKYCKASGYFAPPIHTTTITESLVSVVRSLIKDRLSISLNTVQSCGNRSRIMKYHRRSAEVSVSNGNSKERNTLKKNSEKKERAKKNR